MLPRGRYSWMRNLTIGRWIQCESSNFLEGCRWSNGALCNQRTSRRVTAIVPVHVLGHPLDLDPIFAAAKKIGLKVIEDATEGLGANNT